MDIIKPEMLTGEITRWDILPLSFLKKSAYTGSKGSLRYRIEKATVEVPAEPAPDAPAGASADLQGQASSGEGGPAEPPVQEITVLRVSTWNGPNAFDLTPPEEIRQKDFDFSEDVLYGDLINYLNEQHKMTTST